MSITPPRDPAGAPQELRDLDGLIAGSPFTALLAPRLLETDAAAGRVVFEAAIRPEFERSARENGRWHGGVVAALADTAATLCLLRLTPGGAATVNLRIDYLRPASGDALRATALLRRAGRSMAFVDVEITDPEGRLCALARSNFAVVPAASAPPVPKEQA